METVNKSIVVRVNKSIVRAERGMNMLNTEYLCWWHCSVHSNSGTCHYTHTTATGNPNVDYGLSNNDVSMRIHELLKM